MTSTLVALACDWEGDRHDELCGLLWLIMSPAYQILSGDLL